ncbi:MAG: hypothetical protein ABI452_02805 [Candidatus Limnocylindrales bacterium]
MLDKPKAAAAPRALSPKALARQRQQRQLVQMLGQISDPKAVFEVRLGRDEKALTMRQRIMKAAQEAKKDVVVRKSEKGWLVGMATPERRSKRGRRKKA